MTKLSQVWGPRAERFVDQMLAGLRLRQLRLDAEWRDLDLPVVLMELERERGTLLADMLKLDRAIKAGDWFAARNIARSARTRCVGLGNASMMLFDWLVVHDDPRDMRMGEP